MMSRSEEGRSPDQGKVTHALRLEAHPVNYTPKQWDTLFQQVARVSAQYGNALVQRIIMNGGEFNWGVAKEVNETQVPGRKETYKQALPDAVRSCYYYSARKALQQQIRRALRHEISVPSFTATRIPVRDGVWTFLNTSRNDDVRIRVPLLPKGKGEQPVLRLIPSENPGQKAALERIRKGAYKPGSLNIVCSGRKYFVSISYTFTPEPPPSTRGRVMGIDLGIAYPVAVAFSDSVERNYWDGDDLIEKRSQLLARYRRIQKTITLRDARRSHGKAYKFAPLRRLRRKWEGFLRNWCNRLANRVVDYARANMVEAVALEELDLREPTFFTYTLKGRRLKFPIGKFVTILKNKLHAAGIRVVEVAPAGTTQKCHKCGERQDMPLEEREFVCPCGVRCPRDYNAAKNIAQRGLDKLKAGG